MIAISLSLTLFFSVNVPTQVPVLDKQRLFSGDTKADFKLSFDQATSAKDLLGYCRYSLPFLYCALHFGALKQVTSFLSGFLESSGDAKLVSPRALQWMLNSQTLCCLPHPDALMQTESGPANNHSMMFQYPTFPALKCVPPQLVSQLLDVTQGMMKSGHHKAAANLSQAVIESCATFPLSFPPPSSTFLATNSHVCPFAFPPPNLCSAASSLKRRRRRRRGAKQLRSTSAPPPSPASATPRVQRPHDVKTIGSFGIKSMCATIDALATSYSSKFCSMISMPALLSLPREGRMSRKRPQLQRR